MTEPRNVSSEGDFRRLALTEMEAIAARFERRLDDAQVNHPPTKEWVKKAIRRNGARRCPVRLKRLSLDVIIRYGDALAELFREFPDDVICVQAYDPWIGYQSPRRTDRVDPIQAAMRDAQWTDEWGTQWAHAFGGVGATPVVWPLQDWSQLDDYLAHHVPDPRDPGRLGAARPVLDRHGKTKYCVGMVHLALFERMHSLRGMENLFMDFYTNEREVRRLAEAVTNYQVELMRAWGGTGVDAVFLTDDWGTQTSLMISLEMWEKYFARHYRLMFDEAHRAGMDVIFHSCGNVMKIMAKLIDLGVDVMDPIQPGAMDLDEVAREFGGQVAFFGAIDDQLLASYSPTQVKDVVRRTIDTLGKPFGNALVVAPANVMTPEIPLENLQALFEACHDQ